MSTHHTIDEAYYRKTRHLPGPQLRMEMGYEQQPVLPVITTPLPLSWYPLLSQHKTVTPFLCKLIPLAMNEFTSDPFAAIASITTYASDRNTSVTVTFSIDPFGLSFPETIPASSFHPTLSLDLNYNIDIHRCHLISTDMGTP
jgi:hypothetical protein